MQEKEDVISRQAAINLVRDVCNDIMSGCESQYDPETKDVVYKDIREVDAILKCNKEVRIALRNMPSAQPDVPDTNVGDMVSRQAVNDFLWKWEGYIDKDIIARMQYRVIDIPSAQPDENKYEYHYDHTDCIWYRPEARNRCPVTCAQYRDGWNDAMNYIFRDGEGYRPFRRDKKYEG